MIIALERSWTQQIQSPVSRCEKKNPCPSQTIVEFLHDSHDYPSAIYEVPPSREQFAKDPTYIEHTPGFRRSLAFPARWASISICKFISYVRLLMYACTGLAVLNHHLLYLLFMFLYTLSNIACPLQRPS